MRKTIALILALLLLLALAGCGRNDSPDHTDDREDTDHIPEAPEQTDYIAVIRSDVFRADSVLSQAMSEKVELTLEEESIRLLVKLVNEAEGRRYRRTKEMPTLPDDMVTLQLEDGGSYRLLYWYVSGFSFEPRHPGEDDYYTILTRCDAAGEPVACLRGRSVVSGSVKLPHSPAR